MTSETFVGKRDERALLSLIGLCGVGLLMFGCGGAGSSPNVSSGGSSGDVSAAGNGGGRAAPVAEKDYVAAYVAAVCGSLPACCARFGYPFAESGCASGATSEASGLMGMIDPTTQAYDPNAAGDCLAGLSALLKHCQVEGFGNPFPASCKRILVGKVGLGGPCTGDGQCAPAPTSQVLCQAESSAIGSLSKCIAVPFTPLGTSGAPCSLTCTEGLTSSCSGTGVTSAELASCFTNDGLYCTAANTCGSLPAVGEACTKFCAAGSYCNAGVCVSQQSIGPCSSDDACTSTTYCDVATKQCSPRLTDGTSCTLTKSPQCLSGACNHGACSVRTFASTPACSEGHVD